MKKQPQDLDTADVVRDVVIRVATGQDQSFAVYRQREQVPTSKQVIAKTKKTTARNAPTVTG
jgi:hypothetical protein